MKINGGCHCGAIKYEAEVDPAAVAICHCTDCQVLSGSAFRVVVPVKREDLKLTGEPKTYVKTAESGNKRAQTFCANCGTPIYSTDPVAQQMFFVRLGTAEQRAQLPPQKQTWCRSSMGWSMDLAALPKAAKST